MKYLLFACTLFISQWLSSQKAMTINSVSAYALGTEEQSPNQVRAKALNEAKLVALQRAGVTEQITAYSDFISREENNQMEEIFNSNILNDLQGVVTDVKILDEKKSFNDQGLLQVEVTADISILKFNSGMDASFDLWVDGIKPVYTHGDKLNFNVKPNKPSYIRAFLITEGNEAFQLFPNELEGDFMLEEKRTYNFPGSSIEYELTTEEKKEAHRLILVSLKQDVPFNRTVSYKDIMDWVFQIAPDQRRISTFTFDVHSAN